MRLHEPVTMTAEEKEAAVPPLMGRATGGEEVAGVVGRTCYRFGCGGWIGCWRSTPEPPTPMT